VTVECAGEIPGHLGLTFQLSAELAHGLDLLSHGLELPVHLSAEPLERLALAPYRFRLSIGCEKCLLEGGHLLLDPVGEVGGKSNRLHLFADGGAEARACLIVDDVRKAASRPPDRDSRPLDELHGIKERVARTGPD
jgi:hypothetical protein